MFKTKKYRALERELHDYKNKIEDLEWKLATERDRVRGLINPPEGCKPGNWCKGCRYADTKRQLIGFYGVKDEIVGCLYGACDHRLPEETSVPHFGCL